VSTGWAILFSAYGHLYLRIENIALGNVIIGRHRFLILLWVVLAVAVVYFARKVPRQNPRLIWISNLVSVILILMPVVQGIYYYATQVPPADKPRTVNPTRSENLATRENLPDIYYIVLDSYARSDLLKNLYLYDNSAFIQGLKDRGFYIANCSQSNYNHTWFSISTTFNLDYLENLRYGGKPARPVTLIKHSLLRDRLSEIGYKTVAFETGYDFIDITDADYYFHGNRSWDVKYLFTAPINAFELMFLRTTLASAILELNGISEDRIESAVKKDMMEFIYKRLKDVPELDGPKFVYAHINTTHPPFIYSFTSQQREKENQANPRLADMGAQTRLYRESVEFSDRWMEPIIDQILSRSTTPPIIIIQGDHGPFLSNTPDHLMDILNAYYFPDQRYDRLYPSITPVNSFRVILDQYFDGNYPLLPDVSYYSSARNTYDFSVIENQCVPK
jgi:hypothetical protein